MRYNYINNQSSHSNEDQREKGQARFDELVEKLMDRKPGMKMIDAQIEVMKKNPHLAKAMRPEEDVTRNIASRAAGSCEHPEQGPEFEALVDDYLEKHPGTKRIDAQIAVAKELGRQRLRAGLN